MNDKVNENMQTVTHLEATMIAKEAAEQALAKHADNLPNMLKPMMYEVAEKVSLRNRENMTELFSFIFGVNLEDKKQVRELQQDIYWAGRKRLEGEENMRAAKAALFVGAVKWVGQLAATVIIAVVAIFGFNKYHL